MTTDAAAAILTQSVDGNHAMLCVKRRGQPFGDERKFVLSLRSKQAWLDATDADIVRFKQILAIPTGVYVRPLVEGDENSPMPVGRVSIPSPVWRLSVGHGLGVYVDLRRAADDDLWVSYPFG